MVVSAFAEALRQVAEGALSRVLARSISAPPNGTMTSWQGR
jgi:hypothetical protein